MWQYIPAVLSIIGTISQKNQAQTQNDNQLAWNRYNNQMQYNVARSNIAMQTELAGFNFGMAKQSAAMQAQVSDAQFRMAAKSAEFENAKAAYNGSLIMNTSLYNATLLDSDIANIWESMDLDLQLLANQREVERGQIAVQNFQGVVKEGGSYEDTMVDSITQQYLDETAIKQGATREVNGLQNTIAQNLYQGRLKIQQLNWEGKLNGFNILQGATANFMNARMGAAGTLLQGAANYAGSMINAASNRQSAEYAYQSGAYGSDFQYQNNKQDIRNNFMNGLFGGIGMGVGAYAALKQPKSSYSFLTNNPATGQPSTVFSTSRSSGWQPTTRAISTGHTLSGSLATPGTSPLAGI